MTETPDVTLAELIARYPSAPLTLFARYGVGSRDKLGFRPEQKLKEVLARYLVFDVDAVIGTVRETHERQSTYVVPVRAEEPAVLVDCRSQREFEMVPLPGARYLDQPLARWLIETKPRSVFFCRNGALSAAAAEHFAKKGLEVGFWARGLEEWRETVDPTLPTYGPGAQDSRATLRILAYDRRARLVLDSPVPPGELLEFVGPAPEGLRLWKQRSYLLVENDGTRSWPEIGRSLPGLVGEWRARPVPPLEEPVRALLVESINPSLKSHKGEVELVEIQDEVARLRLLGGCHGCSSAAITVSQEIAGKLMEGIPELLGVEDATDHAAPGEMAPTY